ncbi:MAG: hypothetical protein U0572_10500 [Phycisphaerales bacterium]
MNHRSHLGAAIRFLACGSIVAITLVGCSSGNKQSAPSSTAGASSQLVDLTASQFRSRLAALPDQIDRTVQAANAMSSMAKNDPQGAISQFQIEFNKLRDDVAAIRGEVNQLDLMGADDYFAKFERESGATRNPTAEFVHAKYSRVSDQMLDLRAEANALADNLNAISSAVMSSPDATGIANAQRYLAGANAKASEVKRMVGVLQQELEAAQPGVSR